MIAWLSGILRGKTGDRLVVDVGGVGYDVVVPLSTYGRVPETGDRVTLHVHTYLREDSLSLYGFSTEIEKEVFLLLMGVSGVGPKLALAVLSGLSVEDIVSAIHASDEARLCRVPGVGKKTAARLCLELKDKIKHLAPLVRPAVMKAPSRTAAADDAVSALVNLGYKRPVAEDAVQKILRAGTDLRVEDLIREALGELRG